MRIGSEQKNIGRFAPYFGVLGDGKRRNRRERGGEISVKESINYEFYTQIAMKLGHFCCHHLRGGVD